MSQPSQPGHETVWRLALDQLAQRSTDTLYQTVFQMGNLKAITDDTIVIAFPYAYLAQLLSPEHTAVLNEVFSAVAERPLRTEFIVEADEDDRFSEYAGSRRDIIAQRKDKLLSEERPEHGTPRRPRTLNDEWVFNNYIMRESNQLATAAAKAVATQPGKAYNPLYLYSGTGLGKTHLLHAIANQLWANDPTIRVAVVSAEDFANEHIESIRAKNTKAFRDRYAALDVLLIDDIQFLINKPNCQEAFLHAFNTFHDAQKQIVVTADRKPRELTSFPDHLASRLEGGLIADLQRPTYETRLAILQQKSADYGIAVPVESLSTIANLVTANVRALEGCLKMLRAQMTLRNTTLSHEELEKLVIDFLSTTDRGTEILDLNTIMEKISAHYRVPIPELISKKRTASVAHPRQMVMYFCRKLTNMSLEEIGRALGGRDHSTVLYAYQKIQGRGEIDSQFRREVEFVHSLLTGQRPSDA